MISPALGRALPPPKIAKDGAQASKRMHQEHFEPIERQTLSKLLDLPNMEVSQWYIEQQAGEQDRHVGYAHQQDVAICPRCQQAASRGYDQKKRSVRHLDVIGMGTIIHFEKRRFECEVCGKPFSEILRWIEPKGRHTRAYETEIYEQVKKEP